MRNENKVHYSQVDTYLKCPRCYKYKYVDRIKMQRVPKANDPLLIGSTAHLGNETNYKTAEKFYLDSFPLIDNKQINELMKIEHWVKLVKEFFNDFEVLYVEYNIETDDYQGQIDVITASTEPGYVDLWDLKYSNNYKNYDGTQLNIYKKFLEITSNMKVKYLNYLFIPKTFIREKDSETIERFRFRLKKELKTMEIRIIPVQESPQQVKRFAQRVMLMQQDKVFERCTDKKFCDWCEYKKLCNGEDDYLMKLPENKRTDRRRLDTMSKLIYGPSYGGKSTFMDKFDNVLFANTDGNVDNITSAILRIKDEFTKVGRITTKKLAWDVFLDLVNELEVNKDHNFEKIVLDLVEDLYEYCRIYIFNKLEITHESDAGYGKGWDQVKTEFLNTIKRLKNIGLEVTYLSKLNEGKVTLKGGATITTYAPNLKPAIANVLEGTVGATFRLVVEDNKRYLSCKDDPYQYGGSRYNFKNTKIKLDKKEYLKELRLALEKGVDKEPETKIYKEEKAPEVVEAPEVEKELFTDEPVQVDAAPTRRRRRRS